MSKPVGLSETSHRILLKPLAAPYSLCATPTDVPVKLTCGLCFLCVRTHTAVICWLVGFYSYYLTRETGPQ